MHLDTVFTFCDRDACTLFREVVDQIACYSIYPTGDQGDIDVRADNKPLTEVVTEALGLKALRVDRDRRQRVAGRTRAVGRRQQPRRPRARRGRRLRPHHLHQYAPPQGRHRSHHGARRGSRARPWRRALHDLSDLARSGLLIRITTPRGSNMAFNLRNRSLLTVQDFTQREFHYLLDLARDLKRAKYAGTEQEHLKGKEIVLIFEKSFDAHAVRVRGRRATTRAPMSPISTRRDRRSVTRNRSRTRRACSGACTTRSSFAAIRRRRSKILPSTPACRCSTD